MTLLDIVTKTLVGSRGGLGLLAFMGLIVWASAGRPVTASLRWRLRLFGFFCLAVFLFQFPRLAWLLGDPNELVSRSIDLFAVFITAGVLIGGITLFLIERGVGVERAKRSMAAICFAFAAMISAGWYFR